MRENAFSDDKTPGLFGNSSFYKHMRPSLGKQSLVHLNITNAPGVDKSKANRAAAVESMIGTTTASDF